MPGITRPEQFERAANGYITPNENDFKKSAALGPQQHHHNVSGTGYQPRNMSSDNLSSRAPDPMSLDRAISRIHKEKRAGHGKVSIRDRIGCFTWTWFTMTMATGGIANVLHSVPYEARWTTVIGTVFFIFNLVLFAFNCICITLRFRQTPGSFVRSFTDQVESLFIPAIVVSSGIIMINICEYGIPNAGRWLQQAMEVMFWIYAAVSIMSSAFMYLILWSTQVFPIHTMTPVWVFPAYPLLLAAPFAGNLLYQADLSPHTHAINKLAIACCAITVQGTGFLISFMVCAAFLYRLMTQKLPRDMQRPGVFISIGPGGFTVAGLVHLGLQSNHILPSSFPYKPQAIMFLHLTSSILGLWLWGLSFWFFLVSCGSLWKYAQPHHRMPFQMTWWSFVFPNTALVTATFQIGNTLESNGLRTFGCVMAGLLVLLWMIIFAVMGRSIWRRELLWPKDDSG